MTRLLLLAFVLVIAVAAGVFLENRYSLFDQMGATALVAVETEESGIEHAVKHLDPDYVCPMHPQVIQEMPGSCPICGMDLVQVEHDAGDGELPAVSISPEMVHNLGVRTAGAQRRTLWRRIDTVGYVEYDRDKLRQAGATRVVMPTLVGADSLVRVITRPSTAELVDVISDHGLVDFDLDEFTVDEKDPMNGMTVEATAAHRDHRLLVVAVKQADGGGELGVGNPAGGDQGDPQGHGGSLTVASE